MKITLELPTELETQIRQKAKQANLDISTFVMSVLRNYMEQNQAHEDPYRLSKIESDLLQKINIGFSQEEWERYHELVEKKHDVTITPDELAELIEFSDKLEEVNVRRISYLSELARYRQTTVRAIMQELGIKPVKHLPFQNQAS